MYRKKKKKDAESVVHKEKKKRCRALCGYFQNGRERLRWEGKEKRKTAGSWMAPKPHSVGSG